MGLIDWITRKGRATQQVVASTIRSSERRRAYSAYDANAAKGVSLCFGMAQTAVSRVARDAAAIPLRLYRPASQGQTPSNAVRVSRARKAYLLSGRAGQKAATYRADDELEMVTKHPVLDFLSRPNQYQSGLELRQLHAAFKMLAGSSYIAPDFDERTREMHVLYPQFVKVIGGEQAVVGGFLYGRSDTVPHLFGPDEVWWSKFMPSPFGPLEGLSPLRAVISEQELFAAVTQMELALMDNTGRPDYLLNIEGSMSEAATDALQAKLDAEHRGPQNAGRGKIITNTKATITPLGWAPKDLGNVEMQRHVTTLILAALGVPESEVFLNDANLASSSTGNKQYLRQTVLPMAVQDGEDFTRWVVEDMFGLDGWCLAPEDVVGTDYAQETITLTAQVGAGIASVNEARLALGWDEMDDPEADKLRINGVPLAEAGQQQGGGGLFGFGQPSTITLALEERECKAHDGGSAAIVGVPDRLPEREDHGDTRPADDAGAKDAGAGTADAHGCGAGCDCGAQAKGRHELTQRAWWEQHAKMWASKEVQPEDASPYREDEPATIRLYRKVRKALNERRDEILAATEAQPHGLQARSLGMRYKADDQRELLIRLLKAWGVIDDPKRFAEALASDSEAEAKDLFDAGVEAALGQVGEITELPTLDNSRVVEYFTNYQSAYIRGLASVDETTATMVERAIRDGLEAGDNLRAMQGRIREAFDGESADGQTISEWRSAMVARTETARAAVQGRMGGYAAAGVQRYKFLLAPNSCEFCEAVQRRYADKEVEVGKPLFTQGDTLEGVDGGRLSLDFDDTIVPVHPNCRCDIVPVVG